jgi:hypothetical protein
MKIVKAPNPFIIDGQSSVFLAGSIEMDKAEKWQDKVTEALKDMNVLVLNPRRDNWDASLEQNKDNVQFREQVEWELNALEECDVIVMYFDPNTKSPISLLELGIHSESNKLVVFCPEGFWRKGNVDIVCEYYGITRVDSFEELIRITKKLL